MHKLTIGLFLCAGLLFMTQSCLFNSHSSEDEEEVYLDDTDDFLSDGDSVVAVNSDGDIADTEDELNTSAYNDSISFASSEDALEYLKYSADAYKYESGILPDIAKESAKYAELIINCKEEYFIIVDKGAMKLFLYDKYGQLVKKYGIACGKGYGDKRKKGDCRTVEGFYHVRGVYDSTNWLYTDDNGKTYPEKGQFGPRFIRLGSGVGIHGTSAPWSIGGRRSHGCIRLTNENILDLVEYATKGMCVIINPSVKDYKVDQEEHNNITRLTFLTKVSNPKPKTEEDGNSSDSSDKKKSSESTKSEKSEASEKSDSKSSETKKSSTVEDEHKVSQTSGAEKAKSSQSDKSKSSQTSGAEMVKTAQKNAATATTKPIKSHNSNVEYDLPSQPSSSQTKSSSKSTAKQKSRSSDEYDLPY